MSTSKNGHRVGKRGGRAKAKSHSAFIVGNFLIAIAYMLGYLIITTDMLQGAHRCGPYVLLTVAAVAHTAIAATVLIRWLKNRAPEKPRSQVQVQSKTL